MLKIIHAESEQQFRIAREMMLEYAAWLEFKLCFQGFDDELRTLPGKYAPSAGRLLLALWNDNPAAMGALRPLEHDGENGACEMKRLYVRPEFRGHSIGRALAEKLIQEAREIGYTLMRLDTVPGKMDAAIALYRDLGFEPIEPYYSTPVAGTLFMQLMLGPAPIIRNSNTASDKLGT
ncbi:MAG TPA: GNAT family N-acetyltransferase [Candidatus Acidoferrales bacterium]|jgi:putative acetyltransferase|nr:GNAT family N-acetyltransferase [Candidatus Acidoferrales bacterium]